MEQLIYEVREAKQCLLAGNYELAYEKMQNIDDELTLREIKKRAWLHSHASTTRFSRTYKSLQLDCRTNKGGTQVLLQNVADEFRRIRDIYSIKDFYGEKASIKYYGFLRATRKSKDYYYRHLSAIKNFAEILDVPVAFIIRILQLERIEEFERYTSRS